MLAEYVPTTTIVEEVKKRFNVTMTPQHIYYYKNSSKWRDKLNKFRQKYEDGLPEVPGYSKRVRMERMERLIERCENKLDHPIVREVRGILEQERKEVEGDGSKRNSDNILIQFNSMSDEEVRRELNNTIEHLKKLEARRVVDIGGSDGNSGVPQKVG